MWVLLSYHVHWYRKHFWSGEANIWHADRCSKMSGVHVVFYLYYQLSNSINHTSKPRSPLTDYMLLRQLKLGRWQANKEIQLSLMLTWILLFIWISFWHELTVAVVCLLSAYIMWPNVMYSHDCFYSWRKYDPLDLRHM